MPDSAIDGLMGLVGDAARIGAGPEHAAVPAEAAPLAARPLEAVPTEGAPWPMLHIRL